MGISRCKTCKVLSKLSDGEQNLLQVMMYRDDVSDYAVASKFKELGVEISHDSISYHRKHCLWSKREQIEKEYQELEQKEAKLKDLIFIKRRNDPWNSWRGSSSPWDTTRARNTEILAKAIRRHKK